MTAVVWLRIAVVAIRRMIEELMIAGLVRCHHRFRLHCHRTEVALGRLHQNGIGAAAAAVVAVHIHSRCRRRRRHRRRDTIRIW